jgi:hypothetical protein
MTGLIVVAIAQNAIVGRGLNEDYLIDNLHDLEFLRRFGCGEPCCMYGVSSME